MFRGINPDGLESVAGAVESSVLSAKHQSRVALDLLMLNARSADATELGSVVARIEQWGTDTAETLRWRAAVIRSGQAAHPRIFDTLRVRFATEAVFSLDSIEQTYRQWSEQLRESRQRVDDAVADIGSWLDQSWIDWDVTNNDLHNIWSTLDGLSGAELDRVITALTPRQLQRWLGEMGHSVNGFSREEKQQIFTMLATNGSGESLGKIHEAILAAADTDQDAVDLGIAIRQHSSDSAIVAFVTFVVAQDLAGHRFSGVAPALAMGGVEDTTAIDNAVRAIMTSDGALELIVIDSLVTARVEDTGAACIEINPLASLAGAMSRGTDVELKALGFTTLIGLTGRSGSEVTHLMRARHGEDPSQRTSNRDSRVTSADLELVSAATRLLISDANTVIQELATAIDVDGSITSDYLYQLIDHDQFHNLSRVVNALRGGDDVDIVRFSNVGKDPSYSHPHAQNLAFVAATLNIALERYAAEALTDIENITLVAAVANTITGIVNSLERKSAQIAAGVLGFSVGEFGVDAIATATANDIDNQLATVTGIVLERTKPRRPFEIEPDHLGSARVSWDERYDLVHP